VLRIGLTGGIGAGKSTVSRRLAELGAHVVDADQVAREVVVPGSPGLAAVVAEFGDGVLLPDGSLDRPGLGRIVFGDAEARARLNGILHPRIAARSAELMAAAPADGIVVHDMPLIVENGLAARYHLVVVVDAPESVRAERLVRDRGSSVEDAWQRIRAQATDEQRRAVADVLLDNSGDLDPVLAATTALWQERLVPFAGNLRAGRPAALPEQPVETDPALPAQARRLLARLALVAGPEALRLDHVGPTAEPGTPAPDLLDLQLVVRDLAVADRLGEPLAQAGFVPLPEAAQVLAGRPGGGAERRFGSCDPGRPAVLHVRPADSPAVELPRV
jgi:dephospho-CoA kinase